MAEGNFKDYGKVEALNRLFEGSGFSRQDQTSFSPASGSLVTTASRLFLEGIDFDLTYFPLKHLGYKCAVAVTGELLASMSHPKTLSVKLGLSAKLDYAQVAEIWQGILSAAKEYAYVALDLDLVPSPNGLSVSVSAIGEKLSSTIKSTPEAKSKDLICVSGSLGAAFLGQQILETHKRSFDKSKDDSVQPDLERYKMFIGSYLKPEISSEVVSRMETNELFPTAGVLITHGLSDAVKRLVSKTGLGAKVYAEKIPFEGNSFSFGKELDVDPISAAMNGGDDYKLLFTVSILEAEKFRRDFQTFDIIGHLAQSEVGAVLVTPEGAELPIKAQGWPDPDEE